VEEALRREPQFWRAWNLKGAIEAQLGRNAEALKSLDHSLNIDPYQPEPWVEKKQIFAAAGRWNDERRAFETAIALGAAAGVQLEFALRLEDRGLNDDAVRRLEELAGDTRQSRFEQARALLFAGYLAALDLHDPARAHAAWQKLTATYRDTPFFADQAAYLLGTIDDKEYAARVDALKATTAECFRDFNRGVAAHLRGEDSVARTQFSRCLTGTGAKIDSPSPPASLPERWAWRELRALNGATSERKP
jgi:tetratricopeptide (TPR) repeat protein